MPATLPFPTWKNGSPPSGSLSHACALLHLRYKSCEPVKTSGEKELFLIQEKGVHK